MKSEDSFEEKSDSESGFSEDEVHLVEEPSDQKNVFGKRKRDNVAANENGTSKKRKHKSDLYKPPTTEELNNLKETENLYNNNLFRLQIQELISEVNIKTKRKRNLLNWLDSFSTFLDNMPEYKDILLSQLKKVNKKKLTREEKFINQLADYPQILKTDRDITLKFIKPECSEKFGLYEYNSLPGPNLVLNINLVMPRKCLLTKDFLNNRYLCKRYYYLTYIVEQLKVSNLTTNMTITFQNDNCLLPVLNVEPSGCDKTLVVLNVTPSQDYFKPGRFLPDQNNIKQDLFDMNLDSEVLKSAPTVMYNSSLCYEVTLSLNSAFTKETLKEQESIQEGIKLLSIWLKQREFNVGVGSFTEDLVVYFIVYLFSKKRINKYMSSYQVIRNFWNFISSTDLQQESLSIKDVSKEVLECFKKHFNIVCLDKSGCYNVAAFLDGEVYKRVKNECLLAIKHLDDNKNNSFQQLFLTKFPFYLQYDIILDLTKSLPLEDKYSIKDEERAKYVGYDDLLVTRYISKVIQRGLSKRIVNFVPRLEMGSDNLPKKLSFGVNLNPDEAFNFIELGPALNDHIAAADFRSFWGELSSDRRFRDGSTCVAVYFRANTIKGKRGIIKKILNFVVGEKLDLKYKLYYDDFEEVLVSKKLLPSYPSGTNEETTLKIIKASDELGKKLRLLPMTLKITGVQGASDIFCYTDIFPPIPTNYKVGQTITTIKETSLIFATEKPGMIPRFVQPVECVLQLEHSSRWPSSLEAFHHIKTSFYLEISKILSSDHKIVSNVTPDYIDLFFEGLVFRYRLYIPKEVALVKRSIAETESTTHGGSSENLQIEKALDILPKVIGALKGVQSLYPSFGPGSALIKRWLRSQLIDDYHFPDIVINLLNASLYLNNLFAQTNTPQISFLRFLKFFAEFDWNLQAILVNFNEDITNEEIVELESKLQQNREGYQPLYIIMPFDRGLSIFTKDAPTKEILYRVKQLAQGSLSFVNNIITLHNHVGIKELFIPNFDGYDLLIHLRPLMNPRRHEQIAFTNPESRIIVEKYKADQDEKLPIVSFNPVEEYLRRLRENYGKYATFFHDTYGGKVIAVLWNPKVVEPLNFKVSHVNAGMLVDDRIIFNMDAIIEDFYIEGKGLVKLIDKK